MNEIRASQSVTMLSDGRVLMAGGAGNGILSSAEIYDPATGLFSYTGSMGLAGGSTGTLLSGPATSTPTSTPTRTPTPTLTPTPTPTPVAARLRVSSRRLLFGRAMFGVDGQTSRPRSAIVQNLSATTEVLLEQISASGDFSVVGGAAERAAAALPSCAASLPPKGKCSMTLSFTPTALGTRTGTLTIRSNSASGDTRIALAGRGVPAPLSVVPRAINFGKVKIGSGELGTVTLGNRSPVDLNVSGITSSSPDFAPSLSCLGVLDHANGVCQIQITFQPSARGHRSGILIITDNAVNSPHRVRMSGTGVLP